MKCLFFMLFLSSHSFGSELREGETAYVKMPVDLAIVVQSHITQMESSSYFEEISDQDFFHGHLIFKDSSHKPQHLNVMKSTVSGVLYHTAEYNSRWRMEGGLGLPVYQRTPRSIFGFISGDIVPAVSMLQLDKARAARQAAYTKAGTVYTEDLVTQNPELSNVKHIHGRASTPTKILWNFMEGVESLYVAGQFLVELSDSGDFTTPMGKSYNIYLRLRNSPKSARYLGSERRTFLEPNRSSNPWPKRRQNLDEIAILKIQ